MLATCNDFTCKISKKTFPGATPQAPVAGESDPLPYPPLALDALTQCPNIFPKLTATLTCCGTVGVCV